MPRRSHPTRPAAIAPILLLAIATCLVGISPASAATVPGTPVLLSTTNAGPAVGQVTLRWARSANNGGSALTGFSYAMSTNYDPANPSSATWGAQTVLSVSATAKAVACPAFPRGACTYRVYAKNAIGSSPPSNVVTRRIAVASAPVAKPSSPTTIVPNVIVRWAAPTNKGGASITSYQVQVSTNYSSSSPSSATFTSTGPAVNRASLTVPCTVFPSRSCAYRVAATNAAGTGPWSAVIVIAAMPPSTAPLVWFYNPAPSSVLPTVAQDARLFILNHQQETQRDALRRSGSSGPILEYISAYGMTDTGYGNTLAWDYPGEASSLVAAHPDWALRDAGGKPIRSSEGSYLMDPASAGWQQFWLSQVKSVNLNGWDGIFFDNLDASEARLLAPSVKYPTSASFDAAMNSFLDFVRANYTTPNHKLLYANLTHETDAAAHNAYVSRLDGFMNEAFGVPWALASYMSETEWTGQLSSVDAAGSRGAILVSQGKSTDTRRQQFAFASYLLVARSGVVYRYADAREGYYTAWKFLNYTTALGAPTDTRYHQTDGTWRRDFQKGFVVVDPVNHVSTITIS